ncbi:MAG: 50S ribosomal protein L32e [Candidatus Micrarchaeota archaeon]|nr:50S ribosomal protein L32e [Candidatus Micrarchaeota archaeon]
MKPKILRSKKKSHPRFRRPNVGHTRKRLDDKWRKPRGIDNKQALKRAHMGALPRVGYKNPRAIRGLHPSGKREVLVRSAKDIAALKGGADVAVRISASVGSKKREQLAKMAGELNLKLLN